MSQKKRVVNLTRLIPLFLLIPSLFLNIFLAYITYSQTLSNQVKVIGVTDGDTIVLENKTRLRLRHLDAPELPYCGGKEAKELLTSLVNGKRVKIEEQIPDQRGRAMALIYVGSVLVNEKMLASGWTRYHSDKTTKRALLKQASQNAQANKTGIYSLLCKQTQNTESPQCIIKGNLENKRTSGRKLYYLPNCAQYKFVVIDKDLGEQWFCSEKEALSAGYIKAATCK